MKNLSVVLRTKMSIFEQRIAIDVKSVGPLSFGMRVVRSTPSANF